MGQVPSGKDATGATEEPLDDSLDPGGPDQTGACSPGKDTLHESVVPEDADGTRLDKALALAFDHLSRSRLKALIAEKAVCVDGAVVDDPARKVRAGLTLRVNEPAPKPALPQPEPMDLIIVHEDDHLIVVNKPPGLVVHPAPGHDSGTLVNGLLAHCGPSFAGIGGVARPGIVHRIDKETSGLLVVAKTAQAHADLSVQFADHTIERRYLALVRGAPVQRKGTVDKPIGRSTSDRKKMAVKRSGGRHAVTHYTVQQRYPAHDPAQSTGRHRQEAVATLLECQLETGRTHQIRVHLADLGHPVLGDPLYGRAKAILPRQAPDLLHAFVGRANRQALHARTLGFRHPATGEDIVFECPLAPDLAALVTALESL